MNKENIEFQIKFNETQQEQADILNANIEVFATLQNGFSLIVIVGTQEFTIPDGGRES